MAEEGDSGWVMTWGFFGGRRPKREPLAPPAPPAAPEGAAPARKRPTKGTFTEKAATEVKPARGRRGLPEMLPGLACSLRAFRAPGATVPASDGLAAKYSDMGSSDANPRVREAGMLFAVAEGCIDSDGDHARAVQAASAALSIFQELGDERAEADALRLLIHAQRLKAAALRDAGDEANLIKTERSASTFVMRMLNTFRAAGKKRSLASMLLAAAEVNFEKRSGTHETRHLEVQQALQFAREAQEIFREVKDKRSEACALVVICALYLQSNPTTSRRAAEASLTLFKALGEDYGEAKALHMLAHACFRSGSVKEGLDAAKRAKDIFEALEEEMSAALVSYSAAQRLLALRRPGEAVVHAEQALAMLKDLDAEKGWQAAAEALVVEALITGGEISTGVIRAEAAVGTYSDEGTASDKALALDAAARAQLSAGAKDKALEHAEAGLQVCREMGADRAWEAGLLHLVAQVQLSRGEWGKAAVMASGAWRLFGRVGDDASQARAMLTEAQADSDAGDFYDASETAHDALLLAKELGDKVTEAAALAAAAQAHLSRDEGEEALSTAKEALALFQADADGKAGEAKALRLMAQIHMMNGDNDQASVPARQAQTILKELGDAKAEVEVLKILASLNVLRKRNEEAVRAAQDAFSLGKQLGMDTKQEAEANILVCQALFGRMCHEAETAKDSYQIVSRSETRVLRPAEEAAKLAKQDGDKALMAFALYTLASVTKYLYISLGKLEKLDGVMQTSKEADALFKQLGDESGQGNAKMVMAEVHLVCGRAKEAQDMVDKARNFAESCGDQELLTRSQELLMRGMPAQQQMVMPQMPQQIVPEARSVDVSPEDAMGSGAVAEKPKGLDRLRQYTRAIEDASELLSQRERAEEQAAAIEEGDEEDEEDGQASKCSEEDDDLCEESTGRGRGRGVSSSTEELVQGTRREESSSSKAASVLGRNRSSLDGSGSEASAVRSAARGPGARGAGRRSSNGGSEGTLGGRGGGGSASSVGSSGRPSGRQAQPPSPGPEGLPCLQDEPMQGPEELRAFLTDVLVRRALLLRLMGDLGGAGEDLLEVLQFDACHGLALFWYGKLLVEQHRHKEAPAFLQASLEHHQDTRAQAYALLGALCVTRPNPDWETGLRNLKEAVRLCPSSQPVRITLWICSAGAALHRQQRDARCALGLLDRALAALAQAPNSGAATARSGTKDAAPAAKSGSLSARGPARFHVAGSGGAAASALGGGQGKCPEEVRWSSTRALVRRREELAQGDDVELALECRSFLQLVAREPQQQLSDVPPLLYELRTAALCELGRWEEAVADCKKALALSPADEELQYTLHVASGIVRSAASEYEAAVGHFTKAIRTRPVSTEARVHRAVALASAAWTANSGTAEKEAGRSSQLLADAVQDLEAVEQQAMIAGTAVPAGTRHLRAACLCSAGRADEAWEVLCERGYQGVSQEDVGHGGRSCSSRTLPIWAGGLSAPLRQSALEAEALTRLDRHREAADACSALLAQGGPGQVEAHLMRGCCRSHLGELDLAFEDYHAACQLAPERRDVHEASGDVFFLHGHTADAIAAFDNAAKPGGLVKPGDLVPARLAYKRALAQLAQGSIAGAQKDLGCALRTSPAMPAALRARDGLAALQAVLEGNYRHAHVRVNMLMHASVHSSGGSAACTSSDRLPQLFQPHELLLYRGVCSFYLGESAAAIQDFGTALELARRLAAADACALADSPTSCAPSPAHDGCSSSCASTAIVQADGVSPPPSPRRHRSSASARGPRRRPPELETAEGLEAFECEIMYNVAISQLLARDYAEALATCRQLLEKEAALETFGSGAPCVVWFLIGVCHLAAGDARDEEAREAFMRSYAHDPAYINDFLRRHGRKQDLPTGGPSPTPPPAPRPGGATVRGRIGGPAAAMRPLGGCPARSSWAHAAGSGKDTCDAVPEAVCCLRRSPLMLSSSLAPCRLQVRDVVVWARPSLAWPFVRAPDLGPPASLLRVDLLQQMEPAQAFSLEG